MIRRSQYRCSFKQAGDEKTFDQMIARCRDDFEKLIKAGKEINA